ncbi:hypothetical protein A6A07_22960 [Streptomyces sp. CB03911]|nr:hypothetical protein A6A07_22960 [Streptomyces sp. CB03911]
MPCVGDTDVWPVVNESGLLFSAKVSSVNGGRAARFEVRDADTGQSVVNTSVQSRPIDFLAQTTLSGSVLREGGHYIWRARAEDSAGLSEYTGDCRFTADIVRPTRPAITSADGQDLTAPRPVGVTRRIKVSSSDAQGLAGFCYTFNVPASVSTTGGCDGTWVAAGPDGTATLSVVPVLEAFNNLIVTARDKAGNADDVETRIPATIEIHGTPVTALTKAANDTLVAFRTTSDGRLWAANQTSPSSGFTSWYQLGAPGYRSTPSALLSPAAGGTVHAFVLDNAYGRIIDFAQSGPTSSFDSGTFVGTMLDHFVEAPTAVLTADGSILLAAVDWGNTLWVTRQSAPGGSFRPWEVLDYRITGTASAVLSPAAGGTVHLLVHTTDGHLKAYAESSPGSRLGAGPALPSNGPLIAADPSVTVSAGGGLIVAAVDADGDVWATDQAPTGGDFRYWYRISLFGGQFGATSLVLSPGANGTVNIVARTTDGHIALFGQSGPTSGFSTGAYLGSSSPVFAGDPRVALAANGSMIVTATDTTGTTWAIDQPAPGAGFRTWYRL